MIETGRVCVKIAGRDAGMKCVVVDTAGKNYVLIDGETRRRKCNIVHLEPLPQQLKVKKGASHADVAAAFKEIGITVVGRKPKTTSKQAKPAPAKVPAKPAVKKPAVKKAPAKKAETKTA